MVPSMVFGSSGIVRVRGLTPSPRQGRLNSSRLDGAEPLGDDVSHATRRTELGSSISSQSIGVAGTQRIAVRSRRVPPSSGPKTMLPP
jgi:hypothetical protein